MHVGNRDNHDLRFKDPINHTIRKSEIFVSGSAGYSQYMDATRSEIA